MTFELPSGETIDIRDIRTVGQVHEWDAYQYRIYVYIANVPEPFIVETGSEEEGRETRQQLIEYLELGAELRYGEKQ